MEFLFLWCLFFLTQTLAQEQNITIFKGVDLRRPVKEPFRVAVVTVSQVRDFGWSYSHNEGRVALEQFFGSRVQTFIFEEVAEKNVAFLERLADSGDYDLLITASFGYMDTTEALAKKHPEMYFIHISGYKAGPNFSNAFGRIYQARYLTGLISGFMNVTNVGYVAAFPIPEVLRGINAFYFGLKETNPKATLRVIWTLTWFDLELERGAAEELLDSYGVGLIAQHQDSFETQNAALERGKYSVGYNTDMGSINGIHTITSAIWHWGSVYIHFVQQIFDQQWATEYYWDGLKENVVDYVKPSALVPKGAEDYANKRKQEIIDGKFEVFCGEMVASMGPPGENGCLNDSQLLSMTLLHPDIIEVGVFSIEDDEVTLPDGMIIGISIVNSLCILVVFVFIVGLIIFRNKAIIRAVSPEFNVLILLGGLMLFITVFLLMPSATTELCNAQIWVGSLGFTLLLGVLLAKVWRTAKIINTSKRFVRITFTRYQLIPYILAVLSIELILLILLSAIDAPHREKVRDDDDLDDHEYRYKCAYPLASIIVMAFLVGYKVLQLVAASLLSFSTRKFNKAFNESKQIGYAVYDITFAFVVIVPIVIIIDDVNSRFLLLSLGIIFATLIALLVLYLPRFYMIASGKGDLSFSSTTTLHNSTGGTKVN